MLITIIVTATLTSVGWYFSWIVHERIAEVWLVSSVKTPGRLALKTIISDLEEGRSALGIARLKMLQEAWHHFDADSEFVGSGIGNIMLEFHSDPLPR